MKTEMMLVTPKMAREWLKKNTSNRPLRPFVVQGFLTAYERGEWRVTHQGIAFGSSGALLDGQHRLSFISELPESASVPLNVTFGQDDATFDAIDIGFKRTMSDVYGASAGLVSAARFIAKISNTTNITNSSLSNQFVLPFMNWIQPEFEELTTFCQGNARVWSTAAVRAAAVVQMKRGYDADFIKLAYHSLVVSDIENMPHAARALLQQHVSGKIASARGLDLFLRALRVFDSQNDRRIAKIVISDPAAALEVVRVWINSQMKKSPGNAGQSVAKPSAKFNWKKVA